MGGVPLCWLCVLDALGRDLLAQLSTEVSLKILPLQANDSTARHGIEHLETCSIGPECFGCPDACIGLSVCHTRLQIDRSTAILMLRRQQSSPHANL
jgi:hypothetical protein